MRRVMCDHVIPCLTPEDHDELIAKDRFDQADRWLRAIGWLIIAAAVLYFGWHIILYLQGGHP